MLFHGLPLSFLLSSTGEDHRLCRTPTELKVHLNALVDFGLANRHDVTVSIGESPFMTLNAETMADILTGDVPEDDQALCAHLLESAAIAGAIPA